MSRPGSDFCWFCWLQLHKIKIDAFSPHIGCCSCHHILNKTVVQSPFLLLLLQEAQENHREIGCRRCTCLAFKFMPSWEDFGRVVVTSSEKKWHQAPFLRAGNWEIKFMCEFKPNFDLDENKRKHQKKKHSHTTHTDITVEGWNRILILTVTGCLWLFYECPSHW